MGLSIVLESHLQVCNWRLQGDGPKASHTIVLEYAMLAWQGKFLAIDIHVFGWIPEWCTYIVGVPFGSSIRALLSLCTYYHICLISKISWRGIFLWWIISATSLNCESSIFASFGCFWSLTYMREKMKNKIKICSKWLTIRCYTFRLSSLTVGQ